MMTLILLMLRNLCLTCLIECPLIHLLCRSRPLAGICALLNLLTNPALNAAVLLITAAAGPSWYLPVLLISEAAAASTEALLYRKIADLPLKKAWSVSLLLNAASFSAGLLLQACGVL